MLQKPSAVGLMGVAHYLQNHEAVLCCALKLLGSAVDAQQRLVGCHSSKNVSFEEPCMQTLQPALHVPSPVICGQLTHCDFILQRSRPVLTGRCCGPWLSGRTTQATV